MTTVDTYAVTVTAPAVRMLATTASSGTACATPGEHAIHGRRLLCLRPREPSWLNRPADAPPYRGPMELYLVLPEGAVHNIHEPCLLAATLTEIADLLD